MEKRLYRIHDMILCNCSHQLLLVAGSHCEVCMGMVADVDVTEDGSARIIHDKFDVSYFEALERMFESFEFAA